MAISQVWPVDTSELDNPMWFALNGPHRAFAQRLPDLRWYPPAIAPFVAIPAAGLVPDLDSAQRQGLAPEAYFVGTCPNSLPAGWRFASRSNILQLFPTGEIPEMGEDAGAVLGEADRRAMRELTQIAFPDFFRERTAELGLYLGIYEGEQLVAMAGERLALTGLQEISGVCTHPDFTGRGYARRLTRALLSRHRQRGIRSFLHVSEGNSGARRLYDSMGFVVRASLPMCKVARIVSAEDSLDLPTDRATVQ
ncbi:MAG: GNAT family N-acetyltransferase [Gammaproteobacteria bacterium]